MSFILSDDDGSITLNQNDGFAKLSYSGRFHEEFHTLDAQLMELVSKNTEVICISCSSVLNIESVKKTNFFESIPSRPYYLSTRDGINKKILNPSVCYHCFDYIADKQITETTVLTTVGTCFRQEDISEQSPFRLSEFSMMEFVVVGKEGDVTKIGQLLFDVVFNFIGANLSCRLEKACDSFMGANADHLKKYQKTLNLKTEIIVDTKYGDVAVGSLNWHRDTLTTKYGNNPGNHSCCIAIGLDRLYTAGKLNGC